MINPFEDFAAYPYKEKDIPLDHIIRARESVMERLIEGYLQFVKEEIKDLVFWLAEHHSRVALAYSFALRSVRGLDYDVDDIEELCLEFDRGDRIPYLISGPCGIYLSALCNNAKEKTIRLRLRELKRPFHFLGYGIPSGKVTTLEGNTGNFAGAGLLGGKLIIEGSTGNWVGAEMRKGEIRVDGHIGGIGNTIFGGRIYQYDDLIFPHGPTIK
ncbi:MAG: hypothetical protein SV775_09335 [Thermodesulfobacteriota bacterium]|nr:hypothetical protein [Thermodesulfobacteriota bacterium]